MRVELSPPSLSIVPGRPSVLTVLVTNTGAVISGHELRVLGLDPSWVSVDQSQLSLFPDSAGAFVVTVQLPLGLPAGTRTLEIEVRELTPPNDVSFNRFEITVPAEPDIAITLDPVSVTGGRNVSVGVLLENTGNSLIEAHLEGKDQEGQVNFVFSPANPMLVPGEQLVASASLRARRPWFGGPKIRPFIVEAGPAQGPVVAHGAWVQRPRLTRGNLALFGLLVAATIFAVVLSAALSQVVNQSNSNRDLALQVAEASQTKPVGGSGSIAGTVSDLGSGAPVNGVTVDLFSSSSTTQPIVSTATDATGGYHFSGLGAGSYKLSFNGAGFIQLWYPESLNASGAGVVTLQSAQHLAGIDIHLGGEPATISGTVLGASTAGALLSLELPAGSAPPGSAATSTPAGTAGSSGAATTAAAFSPGATGATLTRTAPSTGSGTSSYALGLSAASGSTAKGAARAHSDTSPTASGTSASGTSGNSGEVSTTTTFPPLPASSTSGGPPVTPNVSTGVSPSAVPAIVTTQTLTAAGTFTLARVPSPAIYDLVVTEPGYAPATQEVDLGGGQNLSGVTIQLHKGDGSVSGTVSSPTGPLGGATVSAAAGTTTINTVTATTAANLGSFIVASLPTPITLTLTVGAPGYASQTLSVTLAAAQQITGIAITLLPGVGSISGTVSTPSGSAVGGVSVSASNGSLTVSTTTLSLGSPGTYSLSGLPVPGTYTVTYSRPDLASQTQAVDIPATGTTDLKGIDVSMVSQTASISGVVAEQTGAGVSQVAVSLVSGTHSYQVVSAAKPTAGAFQIAGIIPGTYNLSFTRQGGVPTSMTVSLAAGQNLVQNETLGPAASIYGYVTLIGTGQAVPSAQVNLYLSTQYPTVLSESTTTSSNGEFIFNNVAAPQSFIVAVSYPAGGSPQETVLINTSLGVASPACGSKATGGSSSTTTTTTTVPGSSTTTSSTSTTTTSTTTTTTTTLPGTSTGATACVASSDPLLVSSS